MPSFITRRTIESMAVAIFAALVGSVFTVSRVSAAIAVPAAPTSVTLSPGITVSWVDNATDESSYVIERSLGAQGFGVIGTVAANVTSFIDVAYGINTYTYRVRARNDQGFSAYATSAPISLISVNSTIPVTATAQPTSGTVPFTVTFTTSSTAPTITWYFGDGETASGPSVTHTYTSYAKYAATLVVTAPAAFGNDVGTAVMLIDALVPPLAAPSDLTATSTSRRTVSLNWTNPISDATEILVFRCPTRKCTNPMLVAALAPATTSYNDTTVKSGTLYDYWMIVRNADGQTAGSLAVTIKAR